MDDALGVLTRRRFLIGAVLFLVVLTSLSVVVGLVGARDNMRFDWELAAVFGTALGTTLLALATGALAYSTSGDVRATWMLARLGREDQLARDKPAVVLTGYTWEDLGSEGE